MVGPEIITHSPNIWYRSVLHVDCCPNGSGRQGALGWTPQPRKGRRPDATEGRRPTGSVPLSTGSRLKRSSSWAACSLLTLRSCCTRWHQALQVLLHQLTRQVSRGRQSCRSYSQRPRGTVRWNLLFHCCTGSFRPPRRDPPLAPLRAGWKLNQSRGR